MNAPAIPARPVAEPVARDGEPPAPTGRLRQQIPLIPNVVPRTVVALAGLVLLVRDVTLLAAYGVWWLRWPNWSQPLADLSDGLLDADVVAAVVLWVALLIWLSVMVTNVRRVGGWRTSVVGAVLAWAIPPFAYLNPWYDLTSGIIGWVPILLLALPAAVVRSAGKEVGRGQTTWLWFGVTVLWLWAASRVAAAPLLLAVAGDSVDDRTKVLTSALFAGLAVISGCAWWGTMRQTMRSIDQGVVDRARPIEDLSTTTAFGQAAALGVDPTAVLVAARSASARPARTGPVRLAPTVWLVAVSAVATVGVFLVGGLVLSPIVTDHMDALERSPTGEAPLPQDFWPTVAVCAGLAIVSLLAFLAWGVLLGRNARRLGARDVSTGRWLIGSLVPIVQMFVPFTYLRDVVGPLGGPEKAIGRWQLALLVAFSVVFVGNIASSQVADGQRAIISVVSGAAALGALTVGVVTMVIISRHMARIAAETSDDVDRPTT